MIINYSHRHRPLGISKRMRFDYFDGVDFLSTKIYAKLQKGDIYSL